MLPTRSKVDWDETRLSSALLERRTAIETEQMLSASMASDLRIALVGWQGRCCSLVVLIRALDYLVVSDSRIPKSLATRCLF